eukprot:151912-Prymnesium_polylepis.1
MTSCPHPSSCTCPESTCWRSLSTRGRRWVVRPWHRHRAAGAMARTRPHTQWPMPGHERLSEL